MSAIEVTYTLSNGKLMPSVGFGTLAPYHIRFTQKEEEVIRDVKAAVKNGYRLIDCAPIYRNERAVGSAIKELIIEDTIRREDIFVVSKLWNTCHRPDLVRPSLMKSLEDLGMQYIDLYLMHWPMAYKEGEDFSPIDENDKFIASDVDYTDTWKAMEDCVDEGLVLSIGVSNFNAEQLQRLMDVARFKPTVNQIECNVQMQNVKLVKYCQSRGVSVTAYAPLGGPAFKTDGSGLPRALAEPVIKVIAEQKGQTTAQICLRYLLQQGLCVIPKSGNPHRIISNYQVFDFELSPSEMEQIEQLDKGRRMNCELGAKDHKHYPFNDILASH